MSCINIRIKLPHQLMEYNSEVTFIACDPHAEPASQVDRRKQERGHRLLPVSFATLKFIPGNFDVLAFLYWNLLCL